jgi:GxxExxY protein
MSTARPWEAANLNAKGAMVAPRSRSDLEMIGRATIGTALAVHTILGPGLLEATYEDCLAFRLRKLGLTAQQQVVLPLEFEELRIERAYRIDLLVEDCVVVEVKAVESLQPVHRAQVLSYLRFGKFRLGYVLNFGAAHLRHGIVRVVNGL